MQNTVGHRGTDPAFEDLDNPALKDLHVDRSFHTFTRQVDAQSSMQSRRLKRSPFASLDCFQPHDGFVSCHARSLSLFICCYTFAYFACLDHSWSF